MTRRLVIALLAVCMSAHFTGCSSSGSKDDTSVAESNDETFAEEGEGDFADTASKTADAKSEAAPADSQAVASDAKPEDTGSDLSLDQPTDQPADQPVANAESTTTETTQTEVAKSDDLSLDEPPQNPPVENITDNPATPSDAGVFDQQKNEPSQEVAAAPPIEPPAATETPVEEPVVSTPIESAPSKPVVYSPYLKVKDAAYTAGGVTLNRVYLARPKDTPKSMSQKLYGANTHAKDLVKWNPVLKRGVRTGDKVYYSSPTNPSDSKMMTYYEEAGIAPQSYVSKDGDNLRTVSKDLLGFKDAWKEVWATNASVESKGKIPGGVELKYWPESGTAAPVQTMAQTQTPPTDPNANLPTTLPEAAPAAAPAAAVAATAAIPPAPQPPTNRPGPAVADNGAGPDPMAPPPPNDAAAAAGNPAQQQQAAAATTAPPSADPLAPPPPPVAPVAKPKMKKVAAASVEEGPDDTTMALAVGGVLLLAAAALFIVIRKNRAKRMDLGQTQV